MIARRLAKQVTTGGGVHLLVSLTRGHLTLQGDVALGNDALCMLRRCRDL